VLTAYLRKFAAGQDATREVTQAKLFTERAMCEVADEAIQITAATATCASTASSAPTATPGSARSAAAPTR
jgi:hypothetical protein